MILIFHPVLTCLRVESWAKWYFVLYFSNDESTLSCFAWVASSLGRFACHLIASRILFFFIFDFAHNFFFVSAWSCDSFFFQRLSRQTYKFWKWNIVASSALPMEREKGRKYRQRQPNPTNYDYEPTKKKPSFEVWIESRWNLFSFAKKRKRWWNPSFISIRPFDERLKFETMGHGHWVRNERQKKKKRP